MNKTFSAVTLALMMILMLGAVSASTVVAGKIYDNDFSQTVSGATVDVTCNNVVLHTISLGDGAYAVTYDGSVCNEGSSLSVHAIETSFGENTVTGEIHNNIVTGLDLNLGVVNVPLVPEFGAVVGVLTILGALGTFFVVRRK
jgi:hypothetical protein